MKEYCVDLEIAKKLKENGFPQKGYFWWHCYKSSDFCIEQNTIQYRQNEQIPCDSGLAIDYIAPTSDEILKELPKKLFGCHLEIDRTDVANYVWYVPIGTDIDQRPKDFVAGSMDEKIANALAQKWLYLKKEGYIK